MRGFRPFSFLVVLHPKSGGDRWDDEADSLIYREGGSRAQHGGAILGYSVDLESDLNLSSATWLPFSTPNTVVSLILPMQDYITFKIAEVVSRFPLTFMLP